MGHNIIDKIYKTQDKVTKDFAANVMRVFTLTNPEQMKDLENGQFYPIKVEDKTYLIIDGKKTKVVIGEDYNYVFDKNNGDFKRWGKTYKDDPDYSPIGPEIWDCEATTICSGVKNEQGIELPCRFCYKSNTSNGKNLTFENFKKMVDSFTKNLGQIAFGVDSHATSNPDLWKMMEYCRSIGVIPNVTVADINDEVADNLKKYVGACAVSRYANKDLCYSSVEKLATKRNVSQINIHALLAMETFDQCMETIIDQARDERLKDMGSIVFLGLKKHGRAKNNYNTLPFDKYRELITTCLKNNARIGFDSCSAGRFEKVVREMDNLNEIEKARLIQCSESCESMAYSFYTSVDCKCFPCSFTEGEFGWEDGIDMLSTSDFIKDIWYHPKNIEWRDKLIKSVCNGCRKCLTFPEINV